MIKDIPCKLKNQADDMTIKKLYLKYLSTNFDNAFFKSLNYDIQKIFINAGFIPENSFEANNFLNGISNINEKEDYEISYAFKDIPADKHFVLNQDNFIYALHPKVWNNLTLEDRLVCLNLAYKKQLNIKNLKNNNRIIWVDNLFKTGQNGHVDKYRNIIAINLRDIISNSKSGGFRTYSTVVHEVNHLKQNKQAKYILNLPDKSSLTPYQQRLNSHNALTIGLTKTSLCFFLDNEYVKKFESIDPQLWQSFIYLNYYKYDYSEISSVNVQYKDLKKQVQICYDYYGENYKLNTDLLKHLDVLNSFNVADKLQNQEIKNFYFDKVKKCNQLRTICSSVYDRFFVLNTILLDNQLQKITLTEPIKKSIAKEFICCQNILKYIYKTLIDSYYLKGHLPEDFNYDLFNYINLFLDKSKETREQTIKYHDTHSIQQEALNNRLMQIIETPKKVADETTTQNTTDTKQNNIL